MRVDRRRALPAVMMKERRTWICQFVFLFYFYEQIGERTPAPAIPASVRASVGIIVQLGYKSAMMKVSEKMKNKEMVKQEKKEKEKMKYFRRRRCWNSCTDLNITLIATMDKE